jgi:hypothetical protein
MKRSEILAQQSKTAAIAIAPSIFQMFQKEVAVL